MQLKYHLLFLSLFAFVGCAFNNTKISEFSVSKDEKGNCIQKYRNGEIFTGTCTQELRPIFGTLKTVNGN